MPLDDIQYDALKKVLRYTTGAAAAGGALALGTRALSNASASYPAPKIPKPIVVDIPRPVDDTAEPAIPIRRVPLPVGMKAAASAVPEWLDRASHGVGLGDAAKNVWDNYVPEVQPFAGAEDATHWSQIPAAGLALGIAAPTAGVGGYYAGSRLAAAAERRRAQSDLASAQKEYQDAILNRTVNAHFQNKDAADVNALLNDSEPTDVEMKQLKQALDACYDRFAKQAGVAETATGTFFPHLLSKDTVYPVSLGMGGLGALSAYLGYNQARDKSLKDQVRRMVQKNDQANANALPAPMVGRIIPVPQLAPA